MQTEARFLHYPARFLAMALTELRPGLIMGKLRLRISENCEIAGYLVTALDLATFPDYPENYTVADPLTIQEFRKAIPKGLAKLSEGAEITPISVQGRVVMAWVAPSMHPHLPIPDSLIWKLGGLPPQRS